LANKYHFAKYTHKPSSLYERILETLGAIECKKHP